MPDRRATTDSRWAATEGCPFPLGVSWVGDEDAFNFALYSRFADSVTLLLYSPSEFVTPVFQYRLDPLRNKSGRIWHCRIPKRAAADASFYAYAIDGPPPAGRFEWHHFDPRKILLDPYAAAVFFPPAFARHAAIGSGSNAGRAPLADLHFCICHRDFDWQGAAAPRLSMSSTSERLHDIPALTFGRRRVGPTQVSWIQFLIFKTWASPRWS
jgi:glycogen operon protein